MRFKNRTAIVTGSTSGIGKLCAECLAREGANVMLTGTNEERLHAAVAEIQSAGGAAAGMTADVRRYDEVKRVVDAAEAQFGSVDILICCAGGASARVFDCYKEFQDVPIEHFDWGIDVNLKGAVYYAHAAMHYMAQQNSGVIVLLGSVAGEEGTEYSIDYAASKAALMGGALKSLAQAGAHHNIRVCTVSPGPVMTREAMSKMKTLLGRAAQTQEVVDLILYLASEQASFITGANFMVDGGRTCMMPG